MKYDDETLMAYADGELEAGQRAEIEAAVARDPELARRVDEHRALRAKLSQAFDPVLSQPVPAHLETLARGSTDAPVKSRGNVVRFPARTARAPSAPWRAREWTAMAASLVLGMFVAWKLLPEGAELGTRAGAMIARGALASALETQLASAQPSDAGVFIGVTIRDASGSFCRSFVSRASSTAGLACREDDDWRIVQTHAVSLQSGELRQAAASLPAPLLQAIEERASGEPLDAAAEQAARDAAWRSSRADP